MIHEFKGLFQFIWNPNPVLAPAKIWPRPGFNNIVIIAIINITYLNQIIRNSRIHIQIPPDQISSKAEKIAELPI